MVLSLAKLPCFDPWLVFPSEAAPLSLLLDKEYSQCPGGLHSVTTVHKTRRELTAEIYSNSDSCVELVLP